MSARTQARLPAGERREQLLDATKALVDAEGFHAVSIEAVARVAGITRPIVYHHFPDGLDALLLALVERETARALEQLGALLAAAEGEPDLIETFAAYLDAVAADPVTWRLVLMPSEGAPAALRDQVRASRAQFAAALASAGGIDSPDPPVTGLMLQALADEGARALIDGTVDRDRLVAHARWLLSALGAGVP